MEEEYYCKSNSCKDSIRTEQIKEVTGKDELRVDGNTFDEISEGDSPKKSGQE